MNRFLVPRWISTVLGRHLAVMPVVVVSGARQTGKSTLVNQLMPDDRRYVTLDDLDAQDMAAREPDALVLGERAITIDEIQRAPDLLHAIKRTVDQDRRPGRFLLTGSANLGRMNRVSESLAGRASYLTLWPLTRREQRGLGACGIWDDLLANPEADWLDLARSQDDTAENWSDLCLRGGYPTPALELDAPAERRIWFDGYVRTYLERDLQDLSAISSLPDFRRVMRASSQRLGQLLNQSALSRELGMSQPTVHRYLNLLETSYLLLRVPPYTVNRTKRVIKQPRFYWSDTGLALHLAGSSEPTDAHLENLILNDLLNWRDSRHDQVEITFWRTRTGEEVDFVVETGGRVLPIEIKATSRPTVGDARHLRSFRRDHAELARHGLLIHDGDLCDWLTDDVLAVPWWRIV